MHFKRAQKPLKRSSKDLREDRWNQAWPLSCDKFRDSNHLNKLSSRDEAAGILPLFSFVVPLEIYSYGREGLTLTWESLQISDKMKSLFVGYGNYELIKENLLLWEDLASIPCEKRASTLTGQLIFQTQFTAKTLPLENLTFNIGVDKQLAELDRKFGGDRTALQNNNVSVFFDYTWDYSMIFDEFFVRFNTRLHKIHKLQLNYELKGVPLLRQAHLVAQDMNIIVGTSGGDWSFQTLPNSLRSAYRREGLPLSSMNTKTSMHTHIYPRTENISNQRRQYPAKGMNGSAPFYTYVCLNNQDICSSNRRLGCICLEGRQRDSWSCNEYLRYQRIDGRNNSSTWTLTWPVGWAAQKPYSQSGFSSSSDTRTVTNSYSSMFDLTSLMAIHHS